MCPVSKSTVSYDLKSNTQITILLSFRVTCAVLDMHQKEGVYNKATIVRVGGSYYEKTFLTFNSTGEILRQS